MPQNIFPNTALLGYNPKFVKYWTPTVVTGTALVSTWAANTGAGTNQPGLTCSCTGTSATISLVSASFQVPQDEGFLVVSVVAKCSNTANSTIVPVQVAFTDSAANSVLTYTPLASAAATSTSAIQYSYVVTVPTGSATAVVTLGAYSWASTGGYNIVYSSPQVLVP